MSEPDRQVDRQPLFWGVLLVVVGVLFTLFELQLVAWWHFGQWWPLVVVAAGVGRIAASAEAKGRRGGVWVVIVGVWLLITTLGVLDFGWTDSWPLLIVAGGLIDVLWPTPEDDRYDGFVWLAVGCWLLLTVRHFFGLTWRDSWPLLLVFVGAAIVLKALLQAIPALAGGRQR
jgi:hypothetical protein